MASPKWLLDPSHCPGFSKFSDPVHIERGETIHHTEYIHVKIPERYALLNITSLVEEVIARSEVTDGYCLVSAMHITAGIYVNDAEGGLLDDISQWLENLAPFGKPYRHHATGEDNGDAHLKSFLTNHETMIPITRGEFDFGTWQQVFYAEFDGKREKRILVKVMGME